MPVNCREKQTTEECPRCKCIGGVFMPEKEKEPVSGRAVRIGSFCTIAPLGANNVCEAAFQ